MNLDLKPQNGKHFINLYKIESIGLKIIGYVSRGVRLLVAPWRASSQSIWHLNVYHKRSLALFLDFIHFFGFSHWFHWLDLSHLGGWADRRRCPPRPRARIGLAGLGPM